jgi:fatty acid desaturase
MKRQQWQELKACFQASKSLRPGWPTVQIFVADIVILGISIFLVQKRGMLCSLTASVCLALVLLHSYLLLHEATHSALSNRRRINDIVGHVCGWLVLMPFLPRQRSHLLHHMWTGHPTGDPANRRIIQGFSVMTDDEAMRLERVWRNWLPMLTLNDRIGMWKDPFRQIKAGTKSRRFEAEIRTLYVYLLGYAVCAGILALSGILFWFLCWYVPALAIQLVVEEMVNLPHHAETPLTEEDDKALPYWEQHRVSHSCKSIPIWSRFVLLNFNLHVAHHLFPWIPWHGLREVDAEIRKILPEIGRDQTRSELAWSLENRKRPLLEIMGHYFDKIPKADEFSSTELHQSPS